MYLFSCAPLLSLDSPDEFYVDSRFGCGLWDGDGGRGRPCSMPARVLLTHYFKCVPILINSHLLSIFVWQCSTGARNCHISA